MVDIPVLVTLKKKRPSNAIGKMLNSLSRKFTISMPDLMARLDVDEAKIEEQIKEL